MDLYHCLRCDHRWAGRNGRRGVDPVQCPNCRSPYWNLARDPDRRPASAKHAAVKTKPKAHTAPVQRTAIVQEEDSDPLGLLEGHGFDHADTEEEAAEVAAFTEPVKTATRISRKRPVGVTRVKPATTELDREKYVEET